MNAKYIYPILALFLVTSCEDPIDVQLDDAEEQLIVDAWIDNRSTIQEIRLSKTLPYFTAEFTPGVENAEVVVRNSQGEVFNFEYTTDGIYTYDFSDGASIGNVGDSFELDINVDGKSYTSETTMNRVPVIDSLTQEFREDEIFLDDGIYCQFFARDFDGLGDTYWIKSYKNGQFLNRPFEINLAYDAGFDSGGEVDGIVFIYPLRDLVNEVDQDGVPVPWATGDEIKVEIHSISNDAFAFMEIMRDQLINSNSGIFAEPLANTRGNVIDISGEETVLGVFNVAAVSEAERVIE